MTPATGRAGAPLGSGELLEPSRSPGVPAAEPRPSGAARARAVADAVLWEGYVLYPYRRSSVKNRVRWQFGVLAPRPWLEARGPVVPTVAGSADAWRQRTECLLETTPGTRVRVQVRFLQVQRRQVQRRAGSGWDPVDAHEVDGRTWLGFDEAVAHEVEVAFALGELGPGTEWPVTASAGTEVEVLPGGEGRLVRSREPISAVLRVEAEPPERPATPAEAPAEAPAGPPGGLRRLRLLLSNAADAAAVPVDAPREESVRWSLVAAHCLIEVEAGAFVSLLEPPEHAAAAARECRNEHTFPVLAGPPGSRDVVLSSPIILYDHPQIAPESPGELFDSGEIDEILSLRALTLTDEEKSEVRATDPRAAAILDRVDELSQDTWAGLHGAVRSLRRVAGSGAQVPHGDAGEPGVQPWWDPGADTSVSPETDAVVVDGVRVSRGSRVRLRPRLRGTDPQDRFLDGRTARVQAVLLDVDDNRHVAVTLDDDPEADLLGGTGRFRYFSPEEIRPLAPERGTGAPS
jgi:hypothetical protein